MVNKGFEEKIHECCCRESCESFKVCCLIDKLYCQCSSSVLCEWLESSLARRYKFLCSCLKCACVRARARVCVLA